jgi:hypothetical protein
MVDYVGNVKKFDSLDKVGKLVDYIGGSWLAVAIPYDVPLRYRKVS